LIKESVPGMPGLWGWGRAEGGEGRGGEGGKGVVRAVAHRRMGGAKEPEMGIAAAGAETYSGGVSLRCRG
jgi:hypothetical protein